MNVCNASSTPGRWAVAGARPASSSTRRFLVPFRFSLLDRVVVGNGRREKRRLEVGLRVRAAEKVAAGTDLAQRVHGLAVLRQIDALRKYVHHSELVHVHYQLLVRGGKPSFEPAGGMQHEVGPGMHRGDQRLRAVIGGLGIGNFGGAKRAAGAKCMLSRRASWPAP